MRGCLGLGLALALSGCASMSADRGTLSVQELEANHKRLANSVVRVRGWLTPCGGRSCAIAGSLKYLESLRKDSPEPPDTSYVSIEYQAEFDESVRSLRDYYSEVILEARVTDQCWSDIQPDGSVIVCADRGNQLIPMRLISVFQKVPADQIRGMKD